MTARCTDPQFEGLVASYALGACSEEEGEAMAAHVQQCAACATELAALEPVREHMRTGLADIRPSPGLRARVMREVRADAALFTAARPDSRRRQPRRWLLPAVAALALGVAVAGVTIVVVDEAPRPSTVAASAAPEGATVRLVRGVGAAELRVEKMPSPGPGRVYAIWLQRGTAAPVPSTLFEVGADGSGRARIPESLQGATKVLVSSEPRGGSPAPTRKPVVLIGL